MHSNTPPPPGHRRVVGSNPDSSKRVDPKAETTDQKNKPPSFSRRLLTDYYGSVVLLLIAVLIGSAYFVIKPKLDAYKLLNADIEGLQKQLVQDQGYLTALNRSVAAAQTISPDVLQKVENALPRTFTIADMLVLLERKAAAYRIELKSVGFSLPSDDPVRGQRTTRRSIAPEMVKINLQMKAQDYFSIKNFLESLELSLRILDVETLNVSGFKEDRGSEFTIQIRTYYFPSDTEAVSASSDRS